MLLTQNKKGQLGNKQTELLALHKSTKKRQKRESGTEQGKARESEEERKYRKRLTIRLDI